MSNQNDIHTLTILNGQENIHKLVMLNTNYHTLSLRTPTSTTADYEQLMNKPSINNIVLIGNISLAELFSGGVIIDGGDSNSFVTDV